MPVRHRLLEPPAGLLDVDGEDYLLAAQRELAEEVGLAAYAGTCWSTCSPRRASSPRPAGVPGPRPAEAAAPDGFVREGEEADMDLVWAPLADLVDAVLDGRLQNPTLVCGVLAAWTARQRDGFASLRPADAPWPARELLAVDQR